MIDIAIDYWSSYPDEIDAEVQADTDAAELAEAGWLRRQDLLRRP